VEFFVYGRDRPATAARRTALTEAHWAYMDRFAGALIARGPTLTDDGEAATGSLHIVDLADLEAARRFAFEDPYAQAGVFADMLIRRWRNDLGRTMWQFDRALDGEQRFLVIGHGPRSEQSRLTAEPHRVILAGPLLSEDGEQRLGDVALIQQPGRPGTVAGPEEYRTVEIHPWQFGGRR
jgi:uncharacterized protein YciI